MTLLDRIFHRQTADVIKREQLVEAERLLAEHMAAAEIHAGLAGVYRARIARLKSELPAQPNALKAVR